MVASSQIDISTPSLLPLTMFLCVFGVAGEVEVGEPGVEVRSLQVSCPGHLLVEMKGRLLLLSSPQGDLDLRVSVMVGLW